MQFLQQLTKFVFCTNMIIIFDIMEDGDSVLKKCTRTESKFKIHSTAMLFTSYEQIQMIHRKLMSQH